MPDTGPGINTQMAGRSPEAVLVRTSGRPLLSLQGVTATFAATTFVASSLLFLVQPMVVRMALPAFGGSPQVWTAGMLFFQLALLLGYGATHLAVTRLTWQHQAGLLLVGCALAVVLLPIELRVHPSATGPIRPVVELVSGLAITVGLPFVLLATTGPLLQRWFSFTVHPRANDPYFLYAASNAGSVFGLLAYPLILEPTLGLRAQSVLWSMAFVAVCLLFGGCAWLTSRFHGDPSSRSAAFRLGAHRPQAGTGTDSPAIAPLRVRTVARWLLLAFVPSSLMLGATTVLSTDVASVPFLWVMPLAVYLLSFTVAFSRLGPIATKIASRCTPVAVVLALLVPLIDIDFVVALVAHIFVVACAGLVCHGLLARDRPVVDHLTRFFLTVAIGGALGGFFNSLLAPLVFPVVIEYQVVGAILLGIVAWSLRGFIEQSTLPLVQRAAMFATAAALPFAVATVAIGTSLSGWLALTVTIGILFTPVARSLILAPMVLVVAISGQLSDISDSVEIDRTFFGVHRVLDHDGIVELIHGTTTHGTQLTHSVAARRQPTSYYHPEEPFGQVISLTERNRVGVLGLGAGGIAAYGLDGQTIVFHEIDPSVERIARTWFSYLDDSQADIRIVLGDGRLTLEEVNEPYDLLVMDAFTSDAIPVHLLTVEAFETYFSKLTTDGMIAVNITNRHVDLEPVLAGIATEHEVEALVKHGDGVFPGAYASRWVVLTNDLSGAAALRNQGWVGLESEPLVWTDSYSSLWQVVR